MTEAKNFLDDFHWLMDVLQHMDVGLVVLDRGFKIQLWNAFMQNHSARFPSDVLGDNIFTSFPELPEAWFRRKAETVFELQNQAFTTWEQRPYLFKFENYRPVTGIAEFMYQNSTIIPLKDTRGQVDHICVIIYDVTEAAINRIQTQAANEKLRELSRTDGLTGLLNRKAWEGELTNEFNRYRRHKHLASLIMFDIDHFKRINDGHGHPAGDAVIRDTARLLTENIRNIDIAGRYGGEEFAVVLVNTDARGAQIVAERLRKAIDNHVVHYENIEIRYTVSLGISEIGQEFSESVQWIDAADKGLYSAKEGGRNRSVIFTQDSTTIQQTH